MLLSQIKNASKLEGGAPLEPQADMPRAPTGLTSALVGASQLVSSVRGVPTTMAILPVVSATESGDSNCSGASSTR